MIPDPLKDPRFVQAAVVIANAEAILGKLTDDKDRALMTRVLHAASAAMMNGCARAAVVGILTAEE